MNYIKKIQWMVLLSCLPHFLSGYELETGIELAAGVQRDSLDFSFDKLQTVTLANKSIEIEAQSFELNLNNLDLFIVQARPWLLIHHRWSLQGEFAYGLVENGTSVLSTHAEITSDFLPERIYSGSLSVKGDIPRQDGRFFSLGFLAGYQFHPTDTLTLMPFVRIAYSQYQLRLPDYPSQTGALLNRFASEQIDHDHFNLPWITPAMGMQLIYETSKTSHFFFEIDCRHSALVSSQLKHHFRPISAFGYGARLGSDFKLLDHVGMGFECGHENVKAKMAWEEATLICRRTSTRATFHLDFYL